jgi:hypothetical protein
MVYCLKWIAVVVPRLFFGDCRLHSLNNKERRWIGKAAGMGIGSGVIARAVDVEGLDAVRSSKQVSMGWWSVGE